MFKSLLKKKIVQNHIFNILFSRCIRCSFTLQFIGMEYALKQNENMYKYNLAYFHSKLLSATHSRFHKQVSIIRCDLLCDNKCSVVVSQKIMNVKNKHHYPTESDDFYLLADCKCSLFWSHIVKWCQCS